MAVERVSPLCMSAMSDNAAGIYNASLKPITARSAYSSQYVSTYPMRNVTADHTKRLPTIRFLRFTRSAIVPEIGLIRPYIHMNAAISAPQPQGPV